MSTYFWDIPCGAAIPFENPHAVSVSLPTLSDIIGYEEGDPVVLDKMESGYPRFFSNKLVQKLTQYVIDVYSISDAMQVLPITSLQAYEILCYLIEDRLEYIVLEGNVFVLLSKEDDRILKIKDYIRNAGLIISSRQAESTLLSLGVIEKVFLETTYSQQKANATIVSVLSDAYKVQSKNCILTNSGANAFFAVCEALIASEKAIEKNIVVQLGWLYVDTMEVIQKRSGNVYLQWNVHDLQQLENWLQEHCQKVVAVVTEVVSNPKLQCVDIVGLYELCKKYGVKLILDATLITPFNASVMRYCDVAVESLSKFACGNGDVLMGAIIVSETSGISPDIFQRFVVSPYEGELKRLSFEIVNYEKRVLQASENTKHIIELLSKKKGIKKVWSVLEESSVDNYRKINTSGVIPGLVTIALEENISNYYDRLQLAKGPSLGTEFTLIMPYVYLAHYDLTKSEEGLKILHQKGMDPNILRISVGVEQLEDIVKAFDSVFGLNK